MLEKLPFSAMLDLPRPTSAVAKERAARLQELVHFCATGGLSQSGIVLFCVIDLKNNMKYYFFS